MKVFVLVEDYPNGNYVSVYSTPEKRELFIQEVIKRINEDHPNLKTVEDLELLDIYLSTYDEEVL